MRKHAIVIAAFLLGANLVLLARPTPLPRAEGDVTETRAILSTVQGAQNEPYFVIYDVEAKRAAAYTIRNGAIEIRAARDVSFDLKLHDFSAPAGQRTSVKDIKALVP